MIYLYINTYNIYTVIQGGRTNRMHYLNGSVCAKEPYHVVKEPYDVVKEPNDVLEGSYDVLKERIG